MMSARDVRPRVIGDQIADDLYLNAGQFHFGGGRVRVKTLLGTCVAITLWHPIRRIGGICHYLLPTRVAGDGDPTGGPGLYADGAVELFNQALRQTNTESDQYIVKIAGGGNMFPSRMMDVICRNGGCAESRRVLCASIGCKNVIAARTLLSAAGYLIASEDIGGCGSRQIHFELWSGDVWVKRGAALPPVLPV